MGETPQGTKFEAPLAKSAILHPTCSPTQKGGDKMKAYRAIEANTLEEYEDKVNELYRQGYLIRLYQFAEYKTDDGMKSKYTAVMELRNDILHQQYLDEVIDQSVKSELARQKARQSRQSSD